MGDKTGIESPRRAICPVCGRLTARRTTVGLEGVLYKHSRVNGCENVLLDLPSVRTVHVVQQQDGVYDNWGGGVEVSFDTRGQAEEWVDWSREHHPNTAPMRIVRRTDVLVYEEDSLDKERKV